LSNVYLDSSALTKLVIDEPESPSLQAVLQGRSLMTSRVAVVEVSKSVARSNPIADPSKILSLVTLLELDANVANIAAATCGPGLRALDAIHVATALLLGAELESFITYDTRQSDAASAAGLHVIAPGVD
jgi:predicted nucleic acid-binding protein